MTKDQEIANLKLQIKFLRAPTIPECRPFVAELETWRQELTRRDTADFHRIRVHLEVDYEPHRVHTAEVHEALSDALLGMPGVLRFTVGSA